MLEESVVDLNFIRGIGTAAGARFIFLFLFFVFLPFLGPFPVAYGGSQARGPIGAVAWPTPEPQQCGIRATSATYTTAHGNPGSLTH